MGKRTFRSGRLVMGKLQILSHSDEPFENRMEAGRIMADVLREYQGQRTVVLGIPRGGVVVAREIARSLDAKLDIVLARKLRTPGHPELAVGSVAEDGKLFLNGEIVRELGVDYDYLNREKTQQLAEIRRRIEQFRRIHSKITLTNKTVIVTDDGIATGATTQAALWAVRRENPRKLVLALPVGPEQTLTRLAEDVDEVICLRTSPFFTAVGQFYLRFEPVEDTEVLKILKEPH